MIFFFFKPIALTLKRFVVGFLVSKKVIVFSLLLSVFFCFFFKGGGEKGAKKGDHVNW